MNRNGIALLVLAVLFWIALVLLFRTPRNVETVYYVAPDGTADGNCAAGAPCSLPRAVALINNGTINDCAVVLLAPGYYSQAALTISGSGRADCRIALIGDGGAILTGTRKYIPPNEWTLTPGRTYTYQAKHADEEFNSSNPAQRNPSNWTPIFVANNATTSLVLDLDFPPRYSNVDSVDKVERQSCTHYDDPAADLVYAHFCNDGPPDAASDFWLSSTGWGSLTIAGNYITIAGINMQHAGKSGDNGFHIAPDVTGTILRAFDFRAVGITNEGINGVIEDGRVGYVILQGEAGGSQCFDRNPAFGVGECWNARASGSAADVGISGSTRAYGNVFRRVLVHRSWNGFSLNGANTAEDNVFTGFPNHTTAFGGTGGAFRRNVMANGQDSMYSEGSDFDSLTVEYNTAFNGTLFWVSRDGKGGTPPQRWVFRGNVVPSLVLDDKTFPGLVSDCNVYIEPLADPGADMFRITGTDGASNRNFNTLKDWQTTGQDARSVELPAPSWTDGSQFLLFTLQSALFDFHLQRTAAARSVPGCAGVAGAYGYGR